LSSFHNSLSLEILLHGQGETGHSAASNISRQSSVVLAQSTHYECVSFAIYVMYFRASLVLTGEC